MDSIAIVYSMCGPPIFFIRVVQHTMQTEMLTALEQNSLKNRQGHDPSHSAVLCTEERWWELLHHREPWPLNGDECAIPRAPQEQQRLKLLNNLKVGLSCLVHVSAAVIVTPATRRPRALRGALPVSAMLVVLPVAPLVALVPLATGLGPAALLGRKRLGCGRANLHQAEPRERMMVGGELSASEHLQSI